MKKVIWLLGILLMMSCQKSEKIPADLARLYPLSINIKVENPMDVQRKDVLAELAIPDLRAKYSDFNPNAFVAFSDGMELPVQAIDLNGDGEPDEIGILMDMAPSQTKSVDVRYARTGDLTREYTKRTQAELSVKVGGKWKGRKYVGGQFENVKFLRVPPEHTDHSFYIRYEGPGWESDKVGYRFYLDWRNAIDIFGKKTHEMVLQNVGQDGFDSYHEMSDWGADIFKVGNSLGVGSIAMWENGKLTMVAETDSLTSQITDNGPVYSRIRTNYFGWKTDKGKYDLTSDLSISAGKRLTCNTLTISGNPENLATGLVKHENTQYLQSNSDNGSNWQYIALWGKQSLMEDSLGIAVLYKKEDLIGLQEDDTNYIVVLKPSAGKLVYGLLAAWEKEPEGIRTMGAFREYLDGLVKKLDRPVRVSIL